MNDTLNTQRGPTILIVDDDREIRDMIQTLLTCYGYDVTVASSAEEALGILSDKKFRLLIADIMMPEMDGVTMVRTFFENNRDSVMQVLFFSARATTNDNADLKALKTQGILREVHFLQKPQPINVIEGKVSDLLAA